MKRLIQKSLNALGYRIERLRPAPAGDDIFVFDFVVRVLNELRGGAVRFLQVGANDGCTEDPLHAWLHRYPWRGVLVEPLPHLAARLREMYRDNPNVIVEEAAVGSAEGAAEFHFLDAVDGIPPSASGLSSLSIETLRSTAAKFGNFERALRSKVVPVRTIAALVEQHGLGELDLLQIDAEGHDLQILESIDFSRLAPAVISYEHANLAPDQRLQARRVLADQGYHFAQWLGDTVCCKPELFPVSPDRLHHRL